MDGLKKEEDLVRFLFLASKIFPRTLMTEVTYIMYKCWKNKPANTLQNMLLVLPQNNQQSVYEQVLDDDKIKYLNFKAAPECLNDQAQAQVAFR